MQHRRGGRNSEAINGNLQKFNDREYSCTENSDSSDEYEEDTHISYQFRRWANHIWSVSNNVTNRLRDLLRNNPSSTSATSDHSDDRFPDESDATSWTTSIDAIESWDHINDGGWNERQHRQHPMDHHETPHEKYSKFEQKYSPVTENRRIRPVLVNEAENSPAYIPNQNVSTYPPVLILPRVHHGANQRCMRTGFYQTRHEMLRCHNARGDQYADGWCQQYHHMGKQWGYEGSGRAEYNYSSLSDRREIPEKLSASVDHPRINRYGRKTTKIEPDDYDLRSVKRCSTHDRDLSSANYRNGHESVSPICATRRSREKSSSRSWRQKNYGNVDTLQNSSHCSQTSTHNNPKKVAWDLQLSDITSREPSFSELPRADHLGKTYVNVSTEEKREIVENVEIPVKDIEKTQDVAVPPYQVTKPVETSEISRDTERQPNCTLDFSENTNCEKHNDNLVNGNSAGWSSKNGVDSLLQSLRARMETLSNIHPRDTITTTSGSMKCNRKENVSSSKKGCIVASCLGSTYLPQCLKYRHVKTTVDSVATNEEGRPSFSERIQDIWQNGSEGWKSSPDHETSISGYDLNPGMNVSSQLSLLGLNQQPVLREYFSEHNSAVTLARILEKLIDSKTKSDSTFQKVIAEAPKPPPRSSRKQSNTCLRVNVGVQKSVPTSTAASQEPASCSRRRSIERRRSQRISRRTCRFHGPEVPVETSRPLQVFSGQNVIPISSIQFTAPVIHPIPNLPGFFPPPQYTRPLSNSCDDPLNRHEDFLIVDNLLVEESDHAPKRGPSSSAKDGHPSLNAEESNRRLINEQDQILSFVFEKIEQERDYEKNIARDTDTSQRHALYHSTSVRVEEPKVAEDRVEPTLKDVSSKSRSWWPKMFQFNQSGTLKEKMSSLLKYLSKKQSGVDCQTQKYYFEKTETDTAVPTPPIRLRRRSTTCTTKCSKSIQWELDTSVSQYTEPIGLVHGIDSQKLNKSTSIAPIIEKVTVANGTNTVKKKPRKTNSKLFLTQKKEVSVGPEIIRDSKETCTDSSNELPSICDRNIVESSDIVDAGKKLSLLPTANDPCSKDISVSTEEDVRPPSDHGQEKDKDFNKKQNFRISRSLSSKIPLATKPVSPFSASPRIYRKRPSTAPILDNSPSSSLPSNESLEVLEAGKSFGKEYASQYTTKKMLFKHNKSSLLRANNSMSRKSAMGQSNIWINTTWNKDMERKCTFKDPVSAVKIDEEKPTPNLSSVEEIPCEKIVSEKELEVNQSDTLLKSSVHKTKRTDSKYSLNEEARILEHSKGEEPSPKADTDVKPCSSHASEKEEKPAMDMVAQKLSNDESTIGGPMDLLEEKASWNTCLRLPSREAEENSGKDETLPTQANVSEKINPELADPEKFKDSTEKMFINSANVSKLQTEKESFLTEHSLFQEKSRGAFGVDRMRTIFNETTVQLQPKLIHSSARKTTKYLLKCHDVHDEKAVLRDKEISVVKHSEIPRLLTKSIPSSGVTPQHDIGKSTVTSSIPLCKEIVPLDTKVLRSDPVNNNSNMSLWELSDSNNRSQNLNAKVSESEAQYLVSVDRTAETASRVSKTAKNSGEKFMKMKKTRHKKTDVIFGMVRKVLNVAIDKAVNVNRETNFEITSLRQNIHQCISTNSEKSSDISTDSLEPIQVRKISNNPDDMLKVTVENSKEVMAARPFEMNHYITQSIITFDLTDISDKPEKLRPSIFNVRFERSVEIAESKLLGSKKHEFKHEKLTDIGSNLKVMENENNSKSSKDGGNVKIDNKVLVEKVKSSMENGVPLKTITIMDPAVLKYSNLIPVKKISPTDKVFEESRSEAKETPPKKFCNTSQDVLSHTESEGECSHTTWSSHENRKIIGTVPEIPSMSNNVELHASKDQNNLVSSIPSSNLNKKSTRFRGTLIPRYKKMPSTRQ